MNIIITRVDAALPLPQYESDGAAGFDIYSRIDMEIMPQTIARIPTNLIIQTPPNHVLMVLPRSSTPSKKGLLIPHGIGIIDEDYSGPEDEILLQVYNFTKETAKIIRGERIGQGLFVPILKANWQEGNPQATSRGGFGSTD